MDERQSVAYRQHCRVPQASPEDEDEELIQLELPEYESRSRLIQQSDHESERSTVTSTKKQTKKKLIKGVLAVLAITGVVIALTTFLTILILASVQVQLLKETQGMRVNEQPLIHGGT